MRKDEKPTIEVIYTPKEDIERMLSMPCPKKPDMGTVWSLITETLLAIGYKQNGKKDLFMKYQNVTIMINMQISAFDKNDYFINIGFLLRQLNDPIKPKFYYDSSCFGRISTNDKTANDIIKAILTWIDNYAQIELIKCNLRMDKSLYNSTKPEVLSFLEI